MLSRMSAMVLSCCFAFTVALLFWGTTRGFDITDEGAYMLGYRYPDTGLSPVTAFDLILGRVLGFLNPGIITFRVVRLLLNLSAALVFAWGVDRWLKAMRLTSPHPLLNLPMIFLFVSMGNFLSYSFGPQGISYNSLTNAVLLTASWLMLCLLVVSDLVDAGLGKRLRLCFTVGLLIGLLFFIKFTSSIVLFVVCALILMGELRASGMQRGLTLIMAMAGGIGASAVVFFVAFRDPVEWYSGFLNAFASFSAGSHNPGVLLNQYGVNLVQAGQELLANYWAVFLGVGIGVRVTRAQGQPGLGAGRPWYVPAIMALGLLFVYKSYGLYSKSQAVLFTVYAVSAILAVQMIGSAVLWWDTMRRRPGAGSMSGKYVGAGLLLGVLPFVGAVGTDNPLLVKCLDFLAPWFALSLMMAAWLYRDLPMKNLIAVLVLAMTVFSQAQIVSGFVYRPYRLPGNLLQQTESVAAIPGLEGIKLDAASRTFLERLHGLLTPYGKFHEGDPVIALYDMPGLVYLLGGRSPGVTWFLGGANEQRRNCAGLSASPSADLKRAVLLVNKEIHPEFLACMRKSGLSYPGGYEFLGGLRSPYSKQEVEVWVPR